MGRGTGVRGLPDARLGWWRGAGKAWSGMERCEGCEPIVGGRESRRESCTWSVWGHGKGARDVERVCEGCEKHGKGVGGVWRRAGEAWEVETGVNLEWERVN